MSSPIRSFVNLVAVAAVLGVIVWREHSWQMKMQKMTPGVVTSGAPAVGGGSEVKEARLMEANAAMQRQLVAGEGRASQLAAEVERLKEALEAAQPAPTPDSLALRFKELRGLAFEPGPVWKPVPVEQILQKVREQVEGRLPVESAQARGRAALAMGFHAEPFEYLPAVVSLAQMGNGGFYEAGTRKFFYREEASLTRADGREDASFSKII